MHSEFQNPTDAWGPPASPLRSLFPIKWGRSLPSLSFAVVTLFAIRRRRRTCGLTLATAAPPPYRSAATPHHRALAVLILTQSGHLTTHALGAPAHRIVPCTPTPPEVLSLWPAIIPTIPAAPVLAPPACSAPPRRFSWPAPFPLRVSAFHALKVLNQIAKPT